MRNGWHGTRRGFQEAMVIIAPQSRSEKFRREVGNLADKFGLSQEEFQEELQFLYRQVAQRQISRLCRDRW